MLNILLTKKITQTIKQEKRRRRRKCD